MNEVKVMLASGKKALVARHNEKGTGIVISYEPPGSVMPRVLQGSFTTFERAKQAIQEYIGQFEGTPAAKSKE
jgi:hypothetical protein